MKILIRKVLTKIAIRRTYGSGNLTGGWIGWREVFGHVVAFEREDGSLSYDW